MSDSDIVTTAADGTDPECICDANIFYTKYKSQIDALLDQHLAAKKTFFDEQRKALDAKRTNIESTSKKKQSRSAKGKLEPLESTDDRKDIPATKACVAKQAIPKAVTHKNDTGRSKKFSKFIASDSLSKDSDLKSSGFEKVEEEQTASLLEKEVHPELDSYAMALDEKLRNLFDDGEMEGESVTERGYIIFDRSGDRSDQSTVNKLSSVSTDGEEEEGYYSFQPSQPPEEWMSESMRKAVEYLKRHKIEDLFKFLGAHLVSANPCNPIEYLINLLDNCLNYRMGYCDPPLLYLPRHVESLFHSMDPMHIGVIDMNQYHTGMFTLGIKEYNMLPVTVNNNMVQKHIFLNEVLNRLQIQLDEMIRCTDSHPPSMSTLTRFYSIKAGESDITQ